MSEKTLTKVVFNEERKLLLTFDHKHQISTHLGNGITSSEVIKAISSLLTDIQSLDD